MAFEPVGDILRDGYKKGYGVAAFNCFHYESIAYAIEAAELERMPVIIMLYPTMRSHIPESTFAAITRDLAAKAKVPVGLHYDHCEDYNWLLHAMHAGFPSVIIDASKYDYEKNLAMTREIVRAAHAMGCEVEAELGMVGSGSKAEDFVDSSKYTDPDEAAAFVRDSGVDYLAVAIGNGHGHYVVEPKIDIERVKALKAKVSVPMVMHGGSGIPDDQLAGCARNGVTKYNFGTQYFQTFYTAAKAAFELPEQVQNGMWLETLVKGPALDFLRSRIRAVNPDKLTV